MRGRPLDPVDESTYIGGQTTEIFDSRMNLYDDAMEEILFEGSAPVDRSILLEVTFTGEHARDFGGPRKEFFSNMLRLIKEKLCVENKEEGGYVLVDNVTARTNRFYYGAGIIFGMNCFTSTMQLFKVPTGGHKQIDHLISHTVNLVSDETFGYFRSVRIYSAPDIKMSVKFFYYILLLLHTAICRADFAHCISKYNLQLNV